MWSAGEPGSRHTLAWTSALVLRCTQVEVGFKLEDQQGPAAEWIALDPVQRDIKRKFRKMLLDFQTDKDGPRHYMDAIRRMCRGAFALALVQVVSILGS